METKIKNLLTLTEAHVREAFAVNTPRALPYHCIAHTEGAVAYAKQIASHYDLSDLDHASLMVATWFHDLGYLFTSPDQHEAKGAELAAEFLKQNGGGEEMIAKVKECILATKIPQHPVSLLSQIICDADLFHLGTAQFEESNKLVRKEKEKMLGQKIPGKIWRKQSLSMLEKIQYHTDYAKNLLQKQKDQNIEHLRQRVKEDEMEESGKNKEEKKKEKNEKSRGVETMFRTTSSNHLQLSEMADAKANIMITVNSIIASVLMSVLFQKLENDERFLIPAMIFLLTALVSIVFAILVTRPNVTQGRFTKEEIEKKKANLLFFGNFHNMSLQDYQSGVEAMMNDQEFLYGSMTRDIYYLGKVLARKYRLLRIAYSFFMFGFVLSVVSFVIAVTMFHQ